MTEAPQTKITIDNIQRKMKFSGTIIKTSLAGALVEIGLEKPGMLHISQLEQGQTMKVEDVVKTGDTVEVWVRSINKKSSMVELSMNEPLALEWSDIKPGTAIKGKVVRLEKFGAFIEIGAERPGLAHISELTHDYIRDISEAIKIGEEVEAQILEVDRKKKKIKLSLKALHVDPSKAVFVEDDEEEQEEVPTAMELAIRKAMNDSETAGPKPSTSDDVDEGTQNTKEREDILARTLKNKVRTE